MKHLPRDDDPQSVMDHLGSTLPLLLREAIDTGFHEYRISRDRDPNAHVEYSDASRANMLYDRITSVARTLIDAAQDDRLGWRFSENRRATEIVCGPYIAVRIKRAKRKRGGISSNVPTQRQRCIRPYRPGDVLGQYVLDYSGSEVQEIPMHERLWLTMGYDLDELEEQVEAVGISRELRKHVLWRVPVQEAPSDVFARLSPTLADLLFDLRSRRSA